MNNPENILKELLSIIEEGSVDNKCSIDNVHYWKSQWETQLRLSKIKEDTIPQSKEELLECIENLMGVFDNPIIQRMNNDIGNRSIEIGRYILESNKQLGL